MSTLANPLGRQTSPPGPWASLFGCISRTPKLERT
jgi:hypothetical protein